MKDEFEGRWSDDVAAAKDQRREEERVPLDTLEKRNLCQSALYNAASRNPNILDHHFDLKEHQISLNEVEEQVVVEYYFHYPLFFFIYFF